MINQSGNKNAVKYSDTEIVFKSVSFVFVSEKSVIFDGIVNCSNDTIYPRTFKLIF